MNQNDLYEGYLPIDAGDHVAVRLLDFDYPERCAGCDPVSCVIEGEEIQGHTWRDLFINLLEKYLFENRINVQELFVKNLLTGSKRPTLLKTKPNGSCRQLSNGYWVYLNFNIPVLVELIGRLCKKCGVDVKDIQITYQDKAGKKSSSNHNITVKNQVPEPIVNILKKDYRSGFAFNAAAVRILTQKSGYMVDGQMQDQLRRMMFRRRDGVYYLADFITDGETRIRIIELAKYALEVNGCFDMTELYHLVQNQINSSIIRDSKDFEDFFLFLHIDGARCVGWHGFRVARLCGKRVDELWDMIAKKVFTVAEYDYGGVITIDDLKNEFPLLSADIIHYIVKSYSLSLVKTEINDMVCYQTLASFGLPDEFADVLSEILEQLDKLEIVPSDSVLHAVLSTKLNVNIKKEYGIYDDKEFQRFISCYSNVFPSREWKAGIFVEVMN